MAQKRRSTKKLSTARGAQAKARARTRRSNPSAIAIDDGSSLKEVGEFVLSGLAGYAGTRLVARVVYQQLMRKWPKGSRHFSVLSTGAAFLGAWYLSGKWDRTAKHRLPITVGAGIAAAQSAIQTYVPKFGWIVSDYQPTVGSASQPKALPASPQPMMEPDPGLVDIPEATSDYYEDDDEIMNPMDPSAGPGESDPVMPFSVDGGDDDFYNLEVN